MKILLTGGAGYIGSHIAVELISSGHTPILVDSFINSHESVIGAIKEITGHTIKIYKIDIRETDKLTDILIKEDIEAVIHLAALKAVGESVEKPMLYYDNNVLGLLSLLKSMQSSNVDSIVFSSSCTVYGEPERLPITEDTPSKPANNPYGATKQMCEQIIKDICNTNSLKCAALRYFNPIGAHPSGIIGELPLGSPSNLVPYLTQATAQKRTPLTVHGNDYDTQDGTGIRDYIHVVDLAKAHLKALEFLKDKSLGAYEVFNIGTGKGVSVMEIIKTFEKVNNISVPYSLGPRRPGDIPCIYASCEKANNILGWSAENSLEDALRDAWNWENSLK